MISLDTIYRDRFESTGLSKRNAVWRVLCTDFFNPLIGPDKDVLDLGCGYGEFINNVAARSKIGVDLNSDSPKHLCSEARFVHTKATDLSPVASDSQDVVFTSNFLEHLPSKHDLDLVFDEVRRVLRDGGRFIVLGPNIRYAYKEYWDFYDHYLPLSHLSLQEGLHQHGFRVIRNIPRFLPYTMKSRLPSADVLVSMYLKMPFMWWVVGKQFLVIARKGEPDETLTRGMVAESLSGKLR
ncbi:MAG: class I SAM-dependent methyltransferase [Xanthobacteraceae bacterium]